MDRKVFFAALRARGSGVFGAVLSGAQVAVMEAILDRGGRLRREELAYILATAYHETGGRMVPSREELSYKTAARLMDVWPARFPTIASARKYLRAPEDLARFVYNGRLGNAVGSDDGWIYRGGGLDHLTGRENYRGAGGAIGVDLEADPERILEIEVAADVIVSGMVSGRYRGRKLADFWAGDGFDPVAARAIINADGRRFDGGIRIGARVAGYARAFDAALRAAGFVRQLEAAGRAAPVAVAPVTPAPVAPVEVRTAEALELVSAAEVAGFWAALIAGVRRIFSKGE